MIYTTHLLRHLRAVIGQNIRRFRTERGMSPDQLACASGLTVRWIDKYESGHFEITLDQLLKIACALEKSVVEMVLD